MGIFKQVISILKAVQSGHNSMDTNAMLYIDKNSQEWIFDYAEDRVLSNCLSKYDFIKLPAGSILKLIGRQPLLGHIYKLKPYEKVPKDSSKV